MESSTAGETGGALFSGAELPVTSVRGRVGQTDKEEMKTLGTQLGRGAGKAETQVFLPPGMLLRQ